MKDEKKQTNQIKSYAFRRIQNVFSFVSFFFASKFMWIIILDARIVYNQLLRKHLFKCERIVLQCWPFFPGQIANILRTVCANSRFDYKALPLYSSLYCPKVTCLKISLNHCILSVNNNNYRYILWCGRYQRAISSNWLK